jgi:hypothetical protein
MWRGREEEEEEEKTNSLVLFTIIGQYGMSPCVVERNVAFEHFFRHSSPQSCVQNRTISEKFYSVMKTKDVAILLFICADKVKFATRYGESQKRSRIQVVVEKFAEKNARKFVKIAQT